MKIEPDSWLARLPQIHLRLIVPPIKVERFHDDLAPATKWRGYAADGSLCYYRHSFTLWDDIFDDEEPYQRLQQSEDFEAWRAVDGQWLRRVQRLDGRGHCGRRAHDTGFEWTDASAVPRL